jgi:hypothetical protein
VADAADRYRVNQPTVIHQTIDGETVIIHLERGLYYSLDATGAEVWQRVAAGQSTTEVSDSLASRFPSQRADVDAAVVALVDRLRSEELIVPAAGLGGGIPESDVVQVRGATFQPPRLERFDDLQDLLLLDPIHAVDETGWPRVETA